MRNGVSWETQSSVRAGSYAVCLSHHESDNQAHGDCTLCVSSVFSEDQCKNAAPLDLKIEMHEINRIEFEFMGRAGRQLSLQFSTVLSRTHIRQLSLPSTRPHKVISLSLVFDLPLPNASLLEQRSCVSHAFRIDRQLPAARPARSRARAALAGPATRRARGSNCRVAQQGDCRGLPAKWSCHSPAAASLDRWHRASPLRLGRAAWPRRRPSSRAPLSRAWRPERRPRGAATAAYPRRKRHALRSSIRIS